jgi:hypothetical protein
MGGNWRDLEKKLQMMEKHKLRERKSRVLLCSYVKDPLGQQWKDLKEKETW